MKSDIKKWPNVNINDTEQANKSLLFIAFIVKSIVEYACERSKLESPSRKDDLK